ncbi:hypothetical protein M8J77_020272 [Diaphorina citri]|nr:hypothetical protein M8J77_020272 [Diaphorina citri]
MEDYIDVYMNFFDEFNKSVDTTDQLPVKIIKGNLRDHDIIGCVIDWTQQYLSVRQCPSSLIAQICKYVVTEMQVYRVVDPEGCGYQKDSNVWNPLKLMQATIKKVIGVCQRHKDRNTVSKLSPPRSNMCLTVLSTKKNARRTMEDKYTIIDDLHEMLNIEGYGSGSFYGVFDGHGGAEAAMYSASRLFQCLAECTHYPTRPDLALVQAFKQTDAQYVEKAKAEFNNTCYQQEDGCPMGSPLSPLLSEFYMYEFEKEIFKLPSNLVDNIKYLHRYVDDILILWLGTRRQLDTLLGKINQIWDGFSLELEYGGKTINFLDLTVTIQENKHKFKIYRKESFADVIIPSNSYHSYHHKMAVFRNYYNRLLNTPLDLDEYREECRTIRAIGFNNGFTSQEMRKIFNSTRRHRMNQLVYSTKPVEPPSIYVKLPFISNLENRLLPTLKKYKCKPAFSSKTLTSLFARKDTIPHEDQSGVYRLTCECGSTYVGMTQRSLKTRLNEHKAAARNNKPEKSNFAKHVLETGHNMNAAKQEILWCGKNFREILYHEQIEIHKAVHSGQCVNEIVETVPNLVYKRDQLISHQVTVSTPPPLSLSATTTTTTPTLSFP